MLIFKFQSLFSAFFTFSFNYGEQKKSRDGHRMEYYHKNLKNGEGRAETF